MIVKMIKIKPLKLFALIIFILLIVFVLFEYVLPMFNQLSTLIPGFDNFVYVVYVMVAAFIFIIALFVLELR